MIQLPDAKRLFCTEEERETRHDRIGENMARVPVWECSECRERRSGFFAAKPPIEVATDGGKKTDE